MENKELFELTNPQKSIWYTEQFYNGSNINNITETPILIITSIMALFWVGLKWFAARTIVSYGVLIEYDAWATVINIANTGTM